jgi:hypothetical protein
VTLDRAVNADRTLIRLPRPVPAGFAWALLGLVVLLELGYIAMGIAAHRSNLGGVASTAVALLVFAVFATVGAVVASHRPENPIGWLFCAAAICMLLANVSSAYLDLAARRNLPGSLAVAVASSWTWIAGIRLLVPLVLIFPDGRPLDRLRRYAKPVVGTWLGLVVVASFVTPGELYPARPPRPAIENPIGVPALSTPLHGLGIAGALALIAAGLVSLVVRWRRAGDERRQITWFLLSVAIVVAVILLSAVASFPEVLWFPVWATIPVAMGIAVLRYRLYEIDVIVRKTLVYGTVSALLAGFYAAIVLALQVAFGSVTRGNELAVAASTLAVAALFRPVRSRIQTVVDRRFYRAKVDAEETLARFGARLRGDLDLDALRAEIAAVVGETMRPAHVSLWLRDGIGRADAAPRNDSGTLVP